MTYQEYKRKSEVEKERNYQHDKRTKKQRCVMKKLNIITFKVPTIFLCYLINGDPTGIEESEVKACDDFINKNNILGISCPSEDGYFSHSNDVIGCACITSEVECIVK